MPRFNSDGHLASVDLRDWSIGVEDEAAARELASRAEEFIAELIAIPGIGPWTAQGALLIALRREDVVLPGDLALRKAVQRAYALDHLPSQQEVLDDRLCHTRILNL